MPHSFYPTLQLHSAGSTTHHRRRSSLYPAPPRRARAEMKVPSAVLNQGSCLFLPHAKTAADDTTSATARALDTAPPTVRPHQRLLHLPPFLALLLPPLIWMLVRGRAEIQLHVVGV